MRDPFVPTGREFDEGLPPERQRGRLGKVVDRLKRKPRHTGSPKVRDFQLTVNPAVGQRVSPATVTPRRQPVEAVGKLAAAAGTKVAPVAPTRTAPNAATAVPREPDIAAQPPPASTIHDATATDIKTPPVALAANAGKAPLGATEGPRHSSCDNSVPAQSESRRPLNANRKLLESPADALEAVMPGGALSLVGWIAANNTSSPSKPVLEYLEAVLSRKPAESPTTELLNWRLAGHRASRQRLERATRAACVCDTLPDALTSVLVRVAEMETPALVTYRRGVEIEAERASAMRMLRRLARDYVSLAPIVSALERRDDALAVRRVAQLPGGYYSAAMRASAGDITRAIEATAAAVEAGKAPHYLPEPGWLPEDSGSPHLLCVAGLIAPLLSERDRNKVLKRLAPDVHSGLSQLDPRSRADVVAWILRLRAPLPDLLTTPPVSRRRVTLRNIGSSNE